MIDKAQAIHSLKPLSDFVVDNGEIIWLDENQAQPTEAEIQAEVQRLQAEYDANQYQRDRAEAYPSIADQLDDLYHNGIEGWKESIKAVKDKYPKE